MKRLGLIGVGAWASRLYEAFETNDDVEIVAYARKSPSTDTFLSRREVDRAEVFTDLFDASKFVLDGVIVAANPTVNVFAIQLGQQFMMPVFVEKPLALDPVVVKELCAYTDSPTPVVVDYTHLHSPSWKKFKERLKSPATVVANFYGEGPFRSFSSLWDYGAHVVAMIFDLVGTTVFQIVKVDREQIQAGEHSGELWTVEGAIGKVKFRFTVGNGSDHRKRIFTVCQEDGTLVSYDGDPRNGGPSDRPLVLAARHFLSLIDKFKASTLKPDEATADLRFSLYVTSLLSEVESLV